MPALQWQAREVSKRTGIMVKVTADEVSEELPEDHKTCIYRVVQEALHNVVQHAGARNVTGHGAAGAASGCCSSIEDDGKGFDPRTEKGMGLLGMEERVSHLGGSFAVESATRPRSHACEWCCPAPAAKTAQEAA